MKATKHSLKKLEALFEELGYALRYEKGNFQSGYCLVENRKIVIVNRFFDTEARVNSLLEILRQVAGGSAGEGLSEQGALWLRRALAAGTATAASENAEAAAAETSEQEEADA